MIDFVENKFVLNLMITSLASGITAIFFFSIHSLLQRQQLSSEVSVVEIAQWKLMVTSCLCLPYALLTEGSWGRGKELPGIGCPAVSVPFDLGENGLMLYHEPSSL